MTPITFITSAGGDKQPLNDSNDRRFFPVDLSESEARKCDNCGEFGECCQRAKQEQLIPSNSTVLEKQNHDLPDCWVVVKGGEIIATHNAPGHYEGIQAIRYTSAADLATVAGLHASICILSNLVDQQRRLLVEVENVCGRDGHGGPLEDGESDLIDRVRDQIAAVAPPAAQPSKQKQDVAKTPNKKHEPTIDLGRYAGTYGGYITDPKPAQKPQFKEFIKWAGSQGYDCVQTCNSDTGEWIVLNPMTADLWKAWQAALGIKGVA